MPASPSPYPPTKTVASIDVNACENALKLAKEQAAKNEATLLENAKRDKEYETKVGEWQRGEGEFTSWKGYLTARNNSTLNQDFWGADSRIPEWARMCWGYRGNSNPGTPDNWKDHHPGGGCAAAAVQLGIHKGEDYRHDFDQWRCCHKVALTCWNGEPRCIRPQSSIDAENTAYEAAKPIKPIPKDIDETPVNIQCCYNILELGEGTNTEDVRQQCEQTLKQQAEIREKLENQKKETKDEKNDTTTLSPDKGGGGIPIWAWILIGVGGCICLMVLLIVFARRKSSSNHHHH